MRALYLFNRVRAGIVDNIRAGNDHDNHFYGMLRLPKFGVEAEYLEIEQFFPKKLCDFLRKHILNIYYVHLPLFFKFFSYDVIFTSTAFGVQLIHALYPFKKPKWVMFDFSIMGLLGDGMTIRQNIFKFIVSKSAGIVTISKDEEEKLRNRFPELADKILFIPLGTDTEYFKPKDVLQTNDILMLGFDPGRDYETLLKAFAKRSVSVVITKSKRVTFELPNNFTAKNFSPAEVLSEYDKAKVFVLSLKLGNGVNDAMGCSTLVEAMSMGKAIVATHTETIKSYIEHGKNGILVPEGDIDALNKAVMDLLADENKRRAMGQAARAFVVANCNSDLFTERLATFFAKL